VKQRPRILQSLLRHQRPLARDRLSNPLLQRPPIRLHLLLRRPPPRKKYPRLRHLPVASFVPAVDGNTLGLVAKYTQHKHQNCIPDNNSSDCDFQSANIRKSQCHKCIPFDLVQSSLVAMDSGANVHHCPYADTCGPPWFGCIPRNDCTVGSSNSQHVWFQSPRHRLYT